MREVINNPLVQVYEGDALTTLRALPDDSVDCCVTSPPYWGLRDYGHAEQIGLEASPFEYIEKMAAVFEEVRRVLKPSGTCWIVIGDSYAGSGKGRMGDGQHHYDPSVKQDTNKGAVNGIITGGWSGAGIKPKDLCGIPWRLAFALQDRGWYLRQDIIWAKPAPMPESMTDRCTRSHEYVFMLTKRARYYYDADAISEIALRTGEIVPMQNYLQGSFQQNGHGFNVATVAESRNRRDVWLIATEGFPDAHFATFPTKLVELCIKAGSPPDGVVLDPFGGCGTTGEVALKLGRRALLIELNPEYVEMIRKNLGLFAVAASA